MKTDYKGVYQTRYGIVKVTDRHPNSSGVVNCVYYDLKWQCYSRIYVSFIDKGKKLIENEWIKWWCGV